jgi:hypothetical protein
MSFRPPVCDILVLIFLVWLVDNNVLLLFKSVGPVKNELHYKTERKANGTDTTLHIHKQSDSFPFFTTYTTN